jgi:hypothetical protein
MRTLRLLLPLLFLPFLDAQTQTIALPECTSNFALNGNAGAIDSLSYSNLPQNCQTWTVTVYNVGFSGFTLTFQSAPPSTTSTPGTFVTYAGSTVSGSNPFTANGTATFSNGTTAIGWVRVALSGTTGSGVVYGVIQGWNSGSSGGGGGGGGGGAITPGVVGTPTVVTLSSSGLTSILAPSSGKSITVYHLSLGFASGVNFQLEYGTTVSTACDTGTTALTGVYQAIQGIALDWDGTFSVTLPSGVGLCANLGSSVTGGGVLVATQK